LGDFAVSASAKSILAPLGELTPNQLADCFVLLAEKTHGTTREGKPFYSCRFSDSRRSVTVMVWSDTPLFKACEEWQPGQFYKIRGTYVPHERFGPQFELRDIRLAQESDREHGFDPALLVERSRYDSDAMLAELRQLVQANIADAPLRRLVLTLLDCHAEALKRLPATQNKFHPFAGGLLEHTLSVTKSCLWLVERYAAHYAELKPPLNKDLVVSAAALHDLGRVLEFADPLGKQSTVPGRLVGHLMLGRDLVRDAAREQGDVNPELVQMLEHLIVAHLALPEWGSPRLPLIPEALILHHADDLDAKLEMYARCLNRDQAPGPFTDRDPILNRQLYKGRSL
jgi:3'-5' exoribonuclease